MMLRLYSCLALAITMIIPAVSAEQPFFADGRTDWTIYLRTTEDTNSPVDYAARELQRALKLVSGADFAVVSNTTPQGRAIIIGDLTNPDVQAAAKDLKLAPGPVETLAVYTLGDRLYLAGNTPRGALYAVYSFLEKQLGVRWLWPEPDGEFIPAKASWTLPPVAFNYTPSFSSRGFHLCGDRQKDRGLPFSVWEARNFMNSSGHILSQTTRRRLGFYVTMGGHGLSLPASLFKEHPEYFALANGRRDTGQICFSNPDVFQMILKRAVDAIRKNPYVEWYGVIPSDTSVYCRCPACAKMDGSTLWFDFRNRLTDALKKEFPDLKFGAMAYSFYLAPPKCPIRNCSSVQIATHDRCNVHPYGHPDCKANEGMMSTLLAWKAVGAPLSLYNYEHDVCRTTSLTSERQIRFFPFLSMLDDAVKTYHKLGIVGVSAEINLIAPRAEYRTLVPTDEYLYQVQHRLSAYLYARLLWEPDRAMTDVLQEWCDTVFGPAAAPMKDYYLAMDRAWGAMPTHLNILGPALPVAPLLLAGDLPARAAGHFATAEACLPRIADPAARERAAAAITRERVFFKQWQNLVYLSRPDDPRRITLPLQSPTNDVEHFYSRPQAFGAAAADGAPATRVSLAWTREALLATWDCRVPRTDNGKGAEDDRVELVLADGISAEQWRLAAGPDGSKRSFREFAGGGRDEQWKPDWRVEAARSADGWKAQMTIPFASLGRPPVPTEFWEARFLRQHAGREESFPAAATALLFFSTAVRNDQTALWWQGWENYRDDALRDEFVTGLGYDLRLVKAAGDLSAQSAGCIAYWFQDPAGTNRIPDGYWSETLVPAVSNGAVAVFGATRGAPVPLERYFNDPLFSVRHKPRAASAEPRPHSIAPGDWSLKPNDLEHAQWPPISRAFTPDYGLVPANSNAWTVLATMPVTPEETCPYILMRPYGKGLVVVCDANLRTSRAKLLDNLVAWNRRRNQDEGK